MGVYHLTYNIAQRGCIYPHEIAFSASIGGYWRVIVTLLDSTALQLVLRGLCKHTPPAQARRLTRKHAAARTRSMSLPIDDFRIEKYDRVKCEKVIDAAIRSRVPLKASTWFEDSDGNVYSITTETPTRELICNFLDSVDPDEDELVIAINNHIRNIADCTDRRNQYRRALNAAAETATATRRANRDLEKKTINQTLANTNVEKQRTTTSMMTPTPEKQFTAASGGALTPPSGEQRSTPHSAVEQPPPPSGNNAAEQTPEPVTRDDAPEESYATGPSNPVGSEQPNDQPAAKRRRRFFWKL